MLVIYLYAAEDLEAELDEMDSSVGSMLGLLDTSPEGATAKSIKHRVSGATGGRSGLKLCRQTREKTTKSSEQVKKSPRKMSQSSAGCKRLLRNSSSEAQRGRLSANADELDESPDKVSMAEGSDSPTSVAAGQPSSTEKRGTQRITRRNSDMKLAESCIVQTEKIDDVTSEFTKNID